ncbi:hypothetical protein D3C85_990180 [compost metagenome]
MSWYQERVSPPSTARQPIKAAKPAICSGVWLKRRAVAAGMISKDVMMSAPTNFIATAITRPINSISTQRSTSTRTPSTRASSSEMVMESRGSHSRHRVSSTRAPPP